jgi:hypothetical protein
MRFHTDEKARNVNSRELRLDLTKDLHKYYSVQLNLPVYSETIVQRKSIYELNRYLLYVQHMVLNFTNVFQHLLRRNSSGRFLDWMDSFQLFDLVLKG